MLRAIVVFLLLANAAFFAWTHNWFAAIGMPMEIEVESHTTPVALLRPESIHLLSPQQLEAEQQLQEQKLAKAAQPPLAQMALAALQPPAPVAPSTPVPGRTAAEGTELAPAPVVAPVMAPVAAPVCKSVGSLSDEQMAVIRPLLASLPNHSWRVDEALSPGRWMVFWGDFDDELVFAAKRAQLETKQLDFAPVRNTPQGTGFSLGRFSSEAAAKQESARLEQRGVNGLRVVQERAGMPVFSLQLSDFSNVPQATRSRLMPLLQGKSLRDCV